jgi:hypothetical protein
MGQSQSGEYVVEDAGILDYGWCPALLNACMTMAKNECASRIRFTMPPPHPVVRYLLHYKSDHEMHVSRDSNGMLAVVNIEETLECMIPEWESRLKMAADLCPRLR